MRQNVVYFCDEKPKSEDDIKKLKKEPEKVEPKGKNRLNELLNSLGTMDEKKLTPNKVDVKKIGVAGRKKNKKKEVKKKEDSDSDSDDEKPTNVVDAAKSIAKKMGGNVRETEAELLSKLLQLPDQSDPKKDKGNKNLK